MKKEIKFRAFQDNEMLISPLSSNYGLARFFGLLYEDTPIMQYTGLKDKNSKDIFEGDIIEENNNKEWRKVVIYDVENAAFGFLTEENECYNWAHEWGECQGFTIEQMEVIGNIHEHPELITNKKIK